MANPTLIAQDTPADSYTLDTVVEAILGMRGLTNDTTTGRTPASAADDADARRLVREAIDDLDIAFPSAWSIQFWSPTWVAGDHSVALPANAMGVLSVTFDGFPLDPWSRDDRYRAERPTSQGGGYESVPSSRPGAYRVMGYSDEDAGATAGAQDYRLVLRLFGTPTTAGALVVEYLSVGAKIANGADKMPMARPLQRWIKWKAAELLAAEKGDTALADKAAPQRLQVQDTLQSWFDGMGGLAARATTAYPRVTRARRRK